MVAPRSPTMSCRMVKKDRTHIFTKYMGGRASYAVDAVQYYKNNASLGVPQPSV